MIISKKKIEPFFYGFMITKENKIIEQYNNEEETHNGCYFLVKKENNKMIISQDYIGCFGCYVYQRDDEFYISNNISELARFLVNKITINKEFYSRIVNARETTFSNGDTLFNEITRYNGDYNIEIVNENLKILKRKQNIYSINFQNKDYLNILDRWYERWINIFRNIDGDIIQDLSGGIDTRILLSITKNAGMLQSILYRNKNKLIKNNKESIEDRKIGQQIIKFYNLPELNKKLINSKINYCNNFIYGNSNFTASIREKPIKKLYRICGNGGFLYHRPNTFHNLLNIRFYNVNEKLTKDYKKYYDSIDIPTYVTKDLKELYIYRKLLAELRDGIKSADYYRNGEILLCPMMDPELNILNPNYNGKSILPTLILKRYCKELLNFEIEGINEKNIDLNFNFEFEKKFNYDIKNKIKNQTLLFYYMRKEDYEKDFKTKSIKDNSHSTGSCPGQTEEFLCSLKQ